MSQPLLSVRDLHIGYGRIAVVRGLSLTVGVGQVVCLIGANGAGKTTTLRGVSGLLRPTSGSVTFDGGEIVGRAAHRIARLGLVQVPEGRQIFAQMTVEGNLRMGAYCVNDRHVLRRRMDEVLSHFPRLRERLDQPAGWMSGGEQQMLAMGRALMAAPRLLLLDEPSMGLAPLMVEEVFSLIAALKAAGKTILVVEQNAQMALEVADHAYVLENGRIRLDGPAAEVGADPMVLSAYLGAMG